MTSETATVAEEEYLQILFWLQEAGLPMTGANVARAMQLSPPTVHEMIGRLERDGYITRGSDRAIAFTDSGAEHAEGIVRRHRLIERFLTDVLGVPWDEVHEEAERLEHAMSPVLEERMLAAIGWPWGQVLASPMAASMRSSSTGDIACSSRSASSCTSSQGTPRTSVRKRSIRRWRRTIPSACSAPLSVNVIVLSASRVIYPSRSSRPTISWTVGAESCIARTMFAPVIGSPASCSQNRICRYSSSATVALAVAMA